MGQLKKLTNKQRLLEIGKALLTVKEPEIVERLNTYIYDVSNVYTEIAAFEKTRKLAVINNTQEEQVTDLYIDGKVVDTLTLKPMEMRWVNY